MQLKNVMAMTGVAVVVLLGSATRVDAGSQQSGDLAVTMTAAPSPVAPGGTVTWTVNVSNPGGVDVNNARLDLTFPSTLDTLAVVSSAPYTCAPPSSGDIQCNIPTHPNGVTATLTFTARVVPAAVSEGTVISVLAAVSSISINDVNPGNNQATAAVTVGAPTTTVPPTTAAPTTAAPTTTAVGGGAGTPTTAPGSIPNTGSEATTAWLFVAGLMVLLGAGTVWLVRRPTASAES